MTMIILCLQRGWVRNTRYVYSKNYIIYEIIRLMFEKVSIDKI